MSRVARLLAIALVLSMLLGTGITVSLAQEPAVSAASGYIVGPPCLPTGCWVSGSAPLPYEIHFENDETQATAPAQSVTIRAPLDSHLDLSSFSLGSFGFGGRTFDVPANSSSYETRLDLTADLGLYVNVSAGLDATSREAFWLFQAVDPTGAAKGFLPPDLNGGQGQGFVYYSIKPLATAQTLDDVGVGARITFDDNAPVDVPPVSNTLDCSKPLSWIVSDSLNVTGTTIGFEWRGVDDSEILDVDLYVSRDGGPFELMLEKQYQTWLYLQVEVGHTYGFYTIARDYVGNREADKTAADLTVYPEPRWPAGP